MLIVGGGFGQGHGPAPIAPLGCDEMDSSGDQAVGVDVGGTKISGVLIDARGRILNQIRRPTPYGDWEILVAAIVDMVATLRPPNATAVGISLPGLVETRTGDLVFSPRPRLEHAPIRSALESKLQLRVVTDNDANAAAWAEHRLGAGRGHNDLVLVAMGTGFGGAVISAGQLLRGANGFAPEIWRLRIELGDGCGTLGDCASGTAITELGREVARREPSSLLCTLAGEPSLVTGEMVTEAAALGDPAALGVLGEVGRVLGMGIAHLVDLFDPALVVVGGGPSEAGDLLLAPARAAMHAEFSGLFPRPEVPIVAAALGNQAGAVGAGLLALPTGS